ncbi:MAG: ATP-dependent DNA helicase [Pseudomonadota bacterium]
MIDFDDILADDGIVANAIEGYRPRTSQRLMAMAVYEAMQAGDHLIVEAGTGTGKTFAYLLPALLSGARTIVSTGTRALQDQLFHRDLPTIANAVGRPVKTALLKGRANYLCLQRLDMSLRDAAALSSNEASILKAWRDTTRTGDKAEVRGIPEDAQVWSRVTSTADNCLGQQCPFFEDCHVVAARRRAQRADLVVVNHHLLLADMAFREGGFVEFLPDADAFVIDEAHQLPDTALQFFGVSVSSRQLADVLDELEVSLRATAGPSLMTLIDDTRTAVAKLREIAPAQIGRHDLADLTPEVHDGITAVRDAIHELIGWLDDYGSDDQVVKQILERLIRLWDRLNMASADDDEEGLRWLEISQRGLRVNMTPLDISARMRSVVDTTEAAWVMTSATLATGESFAHFTDRLGLNDARCLKFSTPFDLANRGMVFLPKGLPQPADPNYTAALLGEVVPLLSATEGGVFILHTSYRSLNQSTRWFADRPELLDGRPLYVQGDAPRDQLLRAFRSDRNAVLLATGTFWEGVDVRGSALTLVVIDKLPFASPDDPLLVARSKWLRAAGRNPFMEHQLPQAILSLKQGVGRLLRDADDHGVIVIGDPRIRGKHYGKQFLKALTPMPVVEDVEKAATFLASFHSALEEVDAE